jgi:hypothetical protein
MKGSVFRACVLLGVLAAASTAAAATPPVVQIPEGFVDLTKGIPGALAGSLPAATLNEARNAGHLAFAIDPTPAAEGLTPNEIADLRPTPLHVDPAEMTKTVSELTKSLATAVPGGKSEVLRADPVAVSGVTGLRVVADIDVGGRAFRDLIFMLPVGPRMLVLTFSVSRARYADYEPRFDAAALATRGLEAAPAIPKGPLRQAVIMGIGVVIAGVLIEVARRKRARDDKGGAAPRPPSRA